MSENVTNNKNVRDDEIDLLDLFRRIGKTFSRWANALGRALLISIVFMLRRWLPLGLSVAMGLGVAFLFKATSDSSYTSDLVLRNNVVSTDEMITYINRLHTFCVEQNKTALTQAISLSPDQIKNINDISAFWIIDNGRDGVPDFVDIAKKHDVYDTVNVRMLDRLNVRVKINSPQELTNVKNGIINYINSQPLFQQRNEVRIRQNKEMLARLDYDILQLDSLQKVKYFEETRSMQPKSGGQMVFLQEQKTQLIYSDIYPLYARKQALEADRDLYQGIVTVLSDFTIPALRDNGAFFYAKKYVPLFLFLRYLC
ncbi:MAG: hypothetical protein IPJ16_11355 [Bacteroidales bacterium]|nr:hypothetical protein [Bacteroidales bacterium]